MKTIRIAEAADAQGVADVYAPAVAGSAISFETEVPTGQEMEIGSPPRWPSRPGWCASMGNASMATRTRRATASGPPTGGAST